MTKLLPLAWLAAALAACAETEEDLPSTIVNAVDVPIDGLSRADIERFNRGDAKFGLPFRAVDGLGPLYIRSSCSACHAEAGRGPGLVQKMVAVEDDGVTPKTDQSELAFGSTIRQGLAAGATTPLAPPDGVQVRVTIRLGPPVIGRGYLEAIADEEIERVEAEQARRGDAIHGRIHRVTFASVPNPDKSFSDFAQGQTGIIGRFGMKARVATLDDFTADAFQGDMGLTTPMRPTELRNPDGLTDDQREGIDLTMEHVDLVAFYLRHIAIPRRVGLTGKGRALFDRARCAVCHVPALHTRADYPITQIANVDAEVYTDLLLHDMGESLADGVSDGDAGGREWKTAPLIGLRFYTSFLHDGRAKSVAEAILAHDGQGRTAADAFRALSPDDRAALVAFVEAL
ncbi:MAG: hypothetical protein KIT31_15930 [Deltaproteobacteria bacterium]|nr:hypothetical protein [Deltaproteobacteria bacterium]